MNDNLHPLRDTQKNCMARLHGYLLAMRGLTGDYSQAVKSSAGGAPVPTDAPGQADAPGDSGSSEGGGVKP